MAAERPVTLSEVKRLLDDASKMRELNPNQKLALDHAHKWRGWSLTRPRP
jgi:DNA-directed RNA polymerase subunit F